MKRSRDVDAFFVIVVSGGDFVNPPRATGRRAGGRGVGGRGVEGRVVDPFLIVDTVTWNIGSAGHIIAGHITVTHINSIS